MQVKKQQLEPDMEQRTGSRLGKKYIKAILSLCLFNFYAEYIMRNTRLDEVQARIKTARRNISNLKYADDTIFMAEGEELKSLLMKVKRRVKYWLKTQHSKNDGDYIHEIKICLFLRRKVMINLDNILKSRDITLPTKIHLVKAMVFPVVMYGCESWTIKKAECQIIDYFELWCWRRLLRVPWTARRSNQSILKEISHEYSLEGLMLKLKLQYFGHLMGRLTHWKRL